MTTSGNNRVTLHDSRRLSDLVNLQKQEVDNARGNPRRIGKGAAGGRDAYSRPPTGAQLARSPYKTDGGRASGYGDARTGQLRNAQNERYERASPRSQPRARRDETDTFNQIITTNDIRKLKLNYEAYKYGR